MQTSILAISLCCGLATAFIAERQFIVQHPTSSRPKPEALKFDWTNITAGGQLTYRPCYGDFECSRLMVPLDWNNASSSNNISLALIRLPAKVPESDPNHGGTIITNPGGPGGSGVQQALQLAKKLQKLLDGPKYYEILSFDPRGIFHSQPQAYCFDTVIDADVWYEQKRAAGGLDDGDYSLKYNWALEKARGNLCAEAENGKFEDGENLRNHLSTAYVARDLLEIVKQINQRRVANFAIDTQVPPSATPSEAKAKLQYIGTSYGTFLGQTFAAMFPDHVSRMVLDANLDPDNWTSRYEASIDDHGKIRDLFFETCFTGGSECALFREYDKSIEDVKSRYDDMIDSLYELPASITGKGRATPITPMDIYQGLFTATYQPLWYFKLFADFANQLVTGVNPGPPFWQLPVPNREAFTDELLINRYMGGEVGPATHCSDGPDLINENLAGYQTYLSNLTHRFGWAGAIQADYKIPCWTWPAVLRTKRRFEGPWNTSVSILFVNNRLDPATPIKNARKMAAQFNGSVLLEQDGAGHGALWPASECMWSRVKSYMQHGELPREGMVCQAMCRPFAKDECRGIDADNYHLIG
ncbi:hypothetical protein DOTSEDRAFT_166897 [Dothistroma septosporum NZE10]|uniref:Peptidase S33 tripeptidyl aminopeptidase-like C-terminal domain-containing protein n=1 Tax=Dothistroma septosporum (strain NZE10 / CBS 128990) TaxID=675120 RepID=N1PZ75_DOTSN|nr:hypothetical protein DOTSEDRAFT_166897 [Dothistroma septosporum NZE10]